MEQMLREQCSVRALSDSRGPRNGRPAIHDDDAIHWGSDKGLSVREESRQVISQTAGEQPDKVAEVTRVTADEEQVLANVFAAAMTRQFKELNQPQTISIRPAA